MTIEVKKVSLDALDDLVALFDQYMVFYKKPSSPAQYKKYLAERIKNNEATVFIAYDDASSPVGFSLNYHSFSSVSQGKVVVLNDLFVSPGQRKMGVGKTLIFSSLNLAKEIGAIRVDLATAKDNLSAQSLYEKIGFIKDNHYFSYSLST